MLPTLPAGAVDAVVADPPYSSGGLWTGARRRPTVEKYSSWARGAGFAGDSRDQRSYLHWSAWWLALAYRAAKPNAYVAVFTDWRQLPTTVDAVQMAGWTWRGILPWVKDLGRYRPAPGFANAAEFVVWGGGPEFRGPPSVRGALAGELEALPAYFAGGGLGTATGHLTEKPVELLEQLLAAAPAGGLILDPFAGSGTTGIAAKRTGREFLGFELDPVWCELANRRLGETDATVGLPLFPTLGAEGDLVAGDRAGRGNHRGDGAVNGARAVQVPVQLAGRDVEPGGEPGPTPTGPLALADEPGELAPANVAASRLPIQEVEQG